MPRTFTKIFTDTVELLVETFENCHFEESRLVGTTRNLRNHELLKISPCGRNDRIGDYSKLSSHTPKGILKPSHKIDIKFVRYKVANFAEKNIKIHQVPSNETCG